MNQFSIFLVVIARFLFTDWCCCVKDVLQVFGRLGFWGGLRAGFPRGCFCGQSGHWELPPCYLNRLSCILVELVFTPQPSGQGFIAPAAPHLCGVAQEVASKGRAAADPSWLADACRCHLTALGLTPSWGSCVEFTSVWAPEAPVLVFWAKDREGKSI